MNWMVRLPGGWQDISKIFSHHNLKYQAVWCKREFSCWRPSSCLNTLRPMQNGRRFADDTFKRIFLNENVIISIKTSLKCVPMNNISALVQIMAWRRPGDKPLSEPMMVSVLPHICVTRPQWVNSYWFTVSWNIRSKREWILNKN